MKNKSYFILIISHAFIGIGFFFLYIHHVRSIFETRTNFAHISKLEREALLRKEDALYFSFYKTIVDAVDFETGYSQLLNLTTIEYPNSVNVLNRFHVLPEIAIGYFYHNFKYVSKRLDIPILSCYSMENDPLSFSCDGIGEPFYFYLEFVWILGGFTVFILYMYASFLSENIFGGIYAVVLYIIFHKNASKIYERPVARENFAYPFILWHMFYLCLCIERAAREARSSVKMRPWMIIKLTALSTISLLCWQFSSIIYATQILIMMTPWSLGLVSSWFSIDYTISQFLSNIFAYYLSYENKKYFLSWQNGPALALLFVSLARIYESRSQRNVKESSLKNFTLAILMALSSQGTLIDLMEKSGYADADDNPYSIYRDLILHWSLQRRANFTTSLLACNSDYAEVELTDFFELVKTLFIKPYCLYGVVVLAKFFRRWRVREIKAQNIDHIERAKKYVLEDFLEENHISMKEMSNKGTEIDLNECYKLLEQCNYDYSKYKIEKDKTKESTNDEHDEFFNDIKKLKQEITLNEKRKESMSNSTPSVRSSPDIVDNFKTESDQATTTKTDTIDDKAKERKANKKTRKMYPSVEGIGYHYLYSIIQLSIFALIGFNIKKLFFLCYTQGCVIAPTLFSKFWYKKHNNIFWTISLAVFFTSIIDPGIYNVQQEYLGNQGYKDDVHGMLEWINLNTESNAVFGGPVEIIGTIHLATRRPIVNHPHLEMRQISERTEGIYSVFSRQQSSDIYNQCSQMKIQYLIVSFNDCSNSAGDECDILNIWDEMQPAYRKFPQFCSELANKNIPSFLKVFSNGHYGIVKMFSQSIQINLKPNKMPEKVI